jgi:polar amino acid transport system substrate-binding protein
VGRFRAGAAALLATGLAAAGCDGFPKDAAGTLELVRAGGPLRVGWSPAEPWVRAGGGGPDGGPAGVEPDLVRAWAASVGARIEWVAGSEAQLVKALQENELDVAVAGFTTASPWGGRTGQTQPYLEAEVVVGAASGTPAPEDWDGAEVRHDRRRPDLAAAIRGVGAVPVAADPGGLTPLAAAYAPELEALGLRPTGKTLATERRLIATAPVENALTLALDQFLEPREGEVRDRLAAEARR